MIKVYSKNKLSDSLKRLILEKVQTKLNKTLQLDDFKFLTDKSIIGGVKIDIESEILDLTLNNRLEKVLDILK